MADRRVSGFFGFYQVVVRKIRLMPEAKISS